MKKITLILFYAFTITLFGCKENQQKTPLQLKMELQMVENDNPREYLQLDSVTMRKNKIKEAGLFSSAKYDGYLISGQVINTATIAKFKDLEINVELYSKTNTVIASKSFVIYEYYEPNSNKDFSIKLDVPNDMESFGTTLIGATPSYD